MLSLRQSLTKIGKEPPIRIPSELPVPSRNLRETLTAWNPTDRYLENPFRDYPYYYKAQTHVHSNAGADAEQSRFEVERAYRSKGYSFIFLTDHNKVTEDPHVGRDEAGRCILHIPAGESGYFCRHHMIVLNPHDWDVVNWADEEPVLAVGGSALINALAAGVALDPLTLLLSLGVGGLVVKDFNDRCDDIQGKIAGFVDAGALVVMAHPRARYKLGGPTYTDDDLLQNCGYLGMEIWCGGSDIEGREVSGADSVDYWDSVLCVGRERRVWGFASDDCENLANLNAFNRGWIVVNSSKPMDSVSDQDMREDIIQNIRDGNFYAVARSPNANPTTDGPAEIGPRLAIWTEGYTVHVRTDQESTIEFKGALMGSHGYRYEKVTEASYTVDHVKDWYVRIEVEQYRTDGNGNEEVFMAYSQPIYIASHGGVRGHVRGECNDLMADVGVRFHQLYGCVTYEAVTDDNENYTISLPRGSYLVEAGRPGAWYERFEGLVGVGDGYRDYDIFFKLEPGISCP